LQMKFANPSLYKYISCRRLAKRRQRGLFPLVKRLEGGVRALIAGYNHWKFGRELDLVLSQLPGLRITADDETETGVGGSSQRQRQVGLLSLQHRLLLVLHQIKIMISRLSSSSVSHGGSSSSGPGHQDAAVVAVMRDFGTAFTCLVESLLADIVSKCVASLVVRGEDHQCPLPSSSSSDSGSEHSSCGAAPCNGRLHDSLVLVCRLGLEGRHICRLFAREGGVAALVRLLAAAAATEGDSDRAGEGAQHREAVLRALSTVCCVQESVREFQTHGGLHLIACALRGTTGGSDSQGATEAARREAAGVLAQVTSPWLEEGAGLDRDALDEHAYDLVSSLTELCRTTGSSETFLLGTAALANLTHLSPLVITAVTQLDALPPILAHLARRVSSSVYILDQVATLLANLAACSHSRRSLLLQQTEAVVSALLLLLATDPERTAAVSGHQAAGNGKCETGSSGEAAALLAATQRVQQKAAIAIGRLAAGGPDFCLGVLSGGGLERLVELAVCRDARIDSDFTLVAVLTAVRRLSQEVDICGELLRLGAGEILHSSILQSIHTFAPMQESFV
jgi:hypothetical protein